jgi:hypothetical protein
MTEQELTQTLIQLADLGVTGIRINYEGGGDSGCIEDIYVYRQRGCFTLGSSEFTLGF